ncbi:MAG: hypothetical protein HYY37_06670 [Candidatus Aenigmarchaeota archaeon]|nr:hypothetical protein [Candidatus Aenigmarchaeota archaeon]
MYRNQIIAYYSRDDIAQQIAAKARDREVACAYFDGAYDRRPNMLQFPADVVQMAKKGITSFHYSVERWSNPMALSSERDNAKLRTGWDLVVDIDSKLGVDESKIAALLICRLLERHGIKNYGTKFSGRRGFHIVVPWHMFPKEVDYSPLRERYPELPRILVDFIRERIAKDLMQELIREKGAKELLKVLDEPPSSLSPFFFVEVEKNWGARHMFRAPYSLNEKTWLVSLPLTFGKLQHFSPERAKPESVSVETPFFSGSENEAEQLLLEALDWHAMRKKEEKKSTAKPVPRNVYEGRIPEELFPPCIKLILAGLNDGRKRSIFTLVNFLRMANWNWQEIEERLFAWNEKNTSPLPRNIVIMHLRRAQTISYTTPNCDNDQFYGSIGICRPDATCTLNGNGTITVKNPVNYPFRKMRQARKERKELKPPEYKCMHCDRGFKSMQSLSMHKSRTHDVVD